MTESKDLERLSNADTLNMIRKYLSSLISEVSGQSSELIVGINAYLDRIIYEEYKQLPKLGSSSELKSIIAEYPRLKEKLKCIEKSDTIEKAKIYDQMMTNPKHPEGVYSHVYVKKLQLQSDELFKKSKESDSLQQQVKQLQEENLKIKIELDDAFGNSAKWKEENQSLKQKIEKIKEYQKEMEELNGEYDYSTRSVGEDLKSILKEPFAGHGQ